jgi:nucleoside-diphosphate-sugar epimerase
VPIVANQQEDKITFQEVLARARFDAKRQGMAENGLRQRRAPAAICRKVIEAKVSGKNEIEIWGSGNQTRSFMFIDDCLKGIDLIINSEIPEPINLGSSEAVTINQIVDMAEEIAGIKLKRNYDLSAPKGVNGRNSDNTLIKKYLNWEPITSLRKGLEKTYRWIYD